MVRLHHHHCKSIICPLWQAREVMRPEFKHRGALKRPDGAISCVACVAGWGISLWWAIGQAVDWSTGRCRRGSLHLVHLALPPRSTSQIARPLSASVESNSLKPWKPSRAREATQTLLPGLTWLGQTKFWIWKGLKFTCSEWVAHRTNYESIVP